MLRSAYNYFVPPPFYHLISPTEIHFLGEQDTEFRERLTTKWIKDYCDARGIPLILPVEPHAIIQSVTHSQLQEIPPTEDAVACSGVYLLELLDSIKHFQKAIKEFNSINYYKCKPTKDSDAALLTHTYLYERHLELSKGKSNLLALYLYLYDLFSNKLEHQPILECKETLEEVETHDFSWMTSTFDTPAYLYTAELYYRFAMTLLNKVKACEDQINSSEQNINQLDKQQQNEFLIAAAYRLLHHCYLESLSAVNRFKKGLNLLDPFTRKNMDLFTINMSGINAFDSAAKLRVALDQLFKLITEKLLPVSYPGFFRPGIIDVDPGRLPWKDRIKAEIKSEPPEPVPTIETTLPPPPPPRLTCKAPPTPPTRTCSLHTEETPADATSTTEEAQETKISVAKSSLSFTDALMERSKNLRKTEGSVKLRV